MLPRETGLAVWLEFAKFAFFCGFRNPLRCKTEKPQGNCNAFITIKTQKR